MAYKYEAEASDGKKYDVTTDHHHSDHDEKKFKDHLTNIIVTVVSGVATGLIVHKFTYKGVK